MWSLCVMDTVKACASVYTANLTSKETYSELEVGLFFFFLEKQNQKLLSSKLLWRGFYSILKCNSEVGFSFQTLIHSIWLASVACSVPSYHNERLLQYFKCTSRVSTSHLSRCITIFNSWAINFASESPLITWRVVIAYLISLSIKCLFSCKPSVPHLI